MNTQMKNIRNLELTDGELEMVIYNNLSACRKMLCTNMGETISTHVTKILTLQKYIYN